MAVICSAELIPEGDVKQKTEKKPLKQAPRAGAGRPKSIPADARNRTIRLTDAEYFSVVEYVKTLRNKANPQAK